MEHLKIPKKLFDDVMLKKELQEVADYLTTKHKLAPVIVELKQVKKGRARVTSRKITIPAWTISHGVTFIYYYIIHEVCHFITYDKRYYLGHGVYFKRIEQDELADFGLKPEYKKAYPKRLSSLNGMSLWEWAKG